jgi:hypothetical protein
VNVPAANGLGKGIKHYVPGTPPATPPERHSNFPFPKAWSFFVISILQGVIGRDSINQK